MSPQQSVSDASVWLMKCDQATVGTLGVCVDDVLAFAKPDHLNPVFGASQGLRQCSRPEFGMHPKTLNPSTPPDAKTLSSEAPETLILLNLTPGAEVP